jgi:hypothetical protein
MTVQVPPLSESKALRLTPEAKFRRLVNEWRSRRIHSSAVEDHILHPAYLQIIGMGTDAVPLILAELEKEPGHWFTALHAITEAQPVPEEDAGNMQKMADAWIKWGRDNGYRW